MASINLKYLILFYFVYANFANNFDGKYYFKRCIVFFLLKLISATTKMVNIILQIKSDLVYLD